MFVDVVLPSRQYRVFTYHVPVSFQGTVKVGSPVLVPLGHAVVSGVVARCLPTSSDRAGWPSRSQACRDVIAVESGGVNHPLNSILIQLIQQIAAYYVVPFSSCLSLILPPRSGKATSRVFLTDEGRKAFDESHISNEDLSAIRLLERRPKGLLRSTFCRLAKVKPATFDRLKKKGWIEERAIQSPSSVTFMKDVAGLSDVPPASLAFDSDPVATESMVGMPLEMDHIRRALQSDIFGEYLYVASEESRWAGLREAITKVLVRNRRAIILVPEIHGVEALASRCRCVWGERVGIYHGNLTSSRKVEEWGCIQRGERDVVLGTRSALFLPLPDVGLIWMECEEDASYQEEHVPYYHAREVSRMRATLESAVLVYATPLPSLEAYAHFPDARTFPSMAERLPLPTIDMIDIRQLPFGTILSPCLQDKMSETLGRGESVIVFLNRKGFSHGLLCKDCGHTPVCPVCQVMLKLYQRPPRLLCTYCGHTETTPEVCAVCQGTVFRFSGVGTQRVEEEVARLFPSMGAARFDREQVKSDREAEEILSDFRRGNIRILIGTEWLFHRMNVPRAALVGMPQADLGLQIPDFRSAERTYQTLVRAVRMADRGSVGAEVVLQTRMPDHHVLQAISKQDPHVFYDQELVLRELLGYPPFSHLFLLVITGTSPAKVAIVVEFFQTKLRHLFPAASVADLMKGQGHRDSLLGPISSKKSGGTQKTRTLFLVKTTNFMFVQQQMEELQRDFHQRFPTMPVVLEIHVDPLDIQ